MEKELEYALQLLGMTIQELRIKMALTNEPSTNPYETIYTDGACPNNGQEANQGGCGVFFGDGDERNISTRFYMPKPTNNRTELFAILMGLENSRDISSLEICSDSQYSINCITKWMKKWKQHDWKTANGKPVKNKELLLQIDDELKEREKKNHSIKFRHVSNFNHVVPKNKINKDHYGNYMADKLANDALID